MADYGIKIAKPGFSATVVPTEANIKNFVVLDQVNALKVYQSGRVTSDTTITHNLGYVPLLEGYKIRVSDESVELIRPDDGEWNIYATTTTVVVDKLYGGTTYDCFYVIFLI